MDKYYKCVYNILQDLVQNPTFCPGYSLSVLNVAGHSSINHVHGLQGVANSIGKMDAYLRLILQTQLEQYSEDIQALYDVLFGTMSDLYKVVSNRRYTFFLRLTSE